MQLASVRQELIRNAKHSINQSSINQQDVKGLRIYLPSLALQTSYSRQRNAVDSLARNLDAAAAKAEAMAAALSAEVFDPASSAANGAEERVAAD